MSGAKHPESDWQSAFLPIGVTVGNSWEPLGGGVLLLDSPLVWLVTAREVVANAGDQHITTWVPHQERPMLLDLTDSQHRSQVAWVHHPAGISASLFPLDPAFTVRAFAESQCTRVRNIQPLQPAASIGRMYGPDAPQGPDAVPAVCDGSISSVDPQSGRIYSTAPLLPNNIGSPLLLASPYGGQVSLAGIQLRSVLLPENDPRMMPVRLSHALCVDAALELVRGEAAQEQRSRLAGPGAKEETE